MKKFHKTVINCLLFSLLIGIPLGFQSSYALPDSKEITWGSSNIIKNKVTFKELSHDELIDVNPCKWVEITKYNHPGMVNRINAIYNEEKKFKEERAYAKQ